MLALSNSCRTNTVRRFYIFTGLFCIGFTLRPFITCIYSFYDFFSVNCGFNAIQIGALTSIPIFCMGMFAITGRYLEKYVTREWVIFISTSLIAGGFLLRSLNHSTIITFLATISGGVGIGIGGALIGGFAREHLAEYAINGLGIYSLGIGLGAIAGSQVALSSWSRNQFILCLIVMGCTLVFGSAFCSWKKITIKPSHLNSRICSYSCPMPFGATEGSWIAIRRMVILIFGIQSLINYTVLLWIKSYYQNLTDSINADISVSTILAIQLLASFLIPQLINRVNNKLLPMAILAGILNVSVLLLYVSPVSMGWIIFAGLGISTGGIFSLSLSLPVIFSHHTDQASSWFTMMLFWGYLISASGPILFGMMLTLSSSYFLALSVLFGLSLMLLIAIYILNNFLKEDL